MKLASVHLQRPAVAQTLVGGIVDENVKAASIALDGVKECGNLRAIGNIEVMPDKE